MTEPTPTETETTEAVEPEATQDTQEAPEDEQEVFPAAYVRQLRQEAAEARVRAKKADDYAKELFHARVAAMGKLADPTDLAFDDKLLDDHPALERAVDELIGRKPHLAARTPRGDIGQGSSGAGATVDLADILRRNA